MRKLILFLAAVSLVLFARKALCYETTFSIESNSFNSLRYEEMRVEEAAPRSIRTGRFLSVDPTWASADLGTPQSWNRYSYVINNPINRTDPDGRCFWDACVAETALVHSAGAALTAATIYVLAPSTVVSGQTNGQVMISQTVDGLKTAGRWLANGNTGGGGDQMAAETYVQNSANQADPPQASGTLPKPPRGAGSVPPQDRDPKRKFSPQEREAKRDAQGGQCANGCGKTIDPSDSNGHHVVRHADGGKTEDKNHAEVCKDCHKELHSPPM